MIDATDRKIVTLLQGNARLSNAELAQAVGLTASSVFERVKKLEQKGVITGYVATVNAAKLGKPLLAFVRLTLGIPQSLTFDAAMSKLAGLSAYEPDILECHDVAGEDCIVLKLRSSGPQELQRLLAAVRECTQSSRSVTSIVLSTVKESSAIAPVAELEAED
jgi:Lrp/AsnC family transcriptional regulator, leucine-responsive regulatory protein